MNQVIDNLSANDILKELPHRIHEIIAPHVANQPDHPALIEGDQTWTYGKLDAAIDAVVNDFDKLEIRPGDRVMIVSENSVALSAMVLACSRCDAWAIVVNPRLSPRELDQIAEHSGTRRVLLNTVVSSEAANHAARLGAPAAQVGPFKAIGIGALNKAAVPEPVDASADRQVAALMYTSGTTGQPKGVMLSHRNVLFAARTSILLRGTAPGDYIYAVLPMSHIVGFSILLVATLMGGATAQLVAKADPATLANALANQGITDLFGVPATYQRLLEYKAVNGIAQLERGRLRHMMVAGAPLDLALKAQIEAEFRQPLLNNYGITECSPGLTGVRSHTPREDDTVGRFLPGIEYRLLDLVGQPVVEGAVGELHVRGPNVMLGYYRAPELTADAIDADGWFKTGDLARLDSDEHLFIAGRSKELIIRSGFNVYPAEVEAVLNAHTSVVQSAVVGRVVEGNEEIVAFVQLLPDANIESAELMAFSAEHLTAYKRPSEIILLDTLPAASTGKILKHKLWEAAHNSA